MLPIYLQGMGTGAGLIIAIGAQNAFVLSQGVKKDHHLIIPLICALCDALLIGAGVTGMGTLLSTSPLVAKIAGIGGAAFLFFYGIRAFASAVRGGRLDAAASEAGSFKAVVLTTLALTLLNPHVYIDTVLLLGGIAVQFQSPGHLVFGAGAVTASFLWFFALSIGAGFLAPLFKREISWRIMDSCVGIIMWGIAFSLARGLAA